MSFFDDLPPPPPEPEHHPYVPKPWQGAPQGWVGGWVPWRVVLSRSKSHYIVLSDFTAYPSGVDFSLNVHRKPGTVKPLGGPGPDTGRRFHHPGLHFSRRREDPRFGIELADGQKAFAGVPHFFQANEEPQGPLLWGGGGGGNDQVWHSSFWLWPLPPPGLLTIAFSWLAQGVEETTTVLDATELVVAAEQAEQLWDVEPAKGRGFGIGTSGDWLTG